MPNITRTCATWCLVYICAFGFGDTAIAQEDDPLQSPAEKSGAGRQDGANPHDLSDVIGAQKAEYSDESLVGFSRDEGFRMRSEDGNYVLRVGIQLGLKLEPAWVDGDSQWNTSVAFARPILGGNVYRPWLGYTLSMELGRGDPFVLDALVDIHPFAELGVRFGQQWTPLSRHDNLGLAQIFFPEHAGVAGYFWSGRERGVTFYGTVLDERLDYFLGVFTGTPIDAPLNLNDNYIVEARVTANPMGPANANEHPFTPEGESLPLRVSFTAQGYYGSLQTSEKSYNISNGVLQPMAVVNSEEIGLASGDVWFQAGPVIAFAEFYWRTLNPVAVGPTFTSYGTWGQVIVNAYRNKLGAGVRFNWLEPNTDQGSDDAFEIEGSLAYYIKPPQVVLKLRQGWLYQKAPNDPDVPLPFVAGRTNVTTLQLNLIF